MATQERHRPLSRGRHRLDDGDIGVVLIGAAHQPPGIRRREDGVATGHERGDERPALA